MNITEILELANLISPIVDFPELAIESAARDANGKVRYESSQKLVQLATVSLGGKEFPVSFNGGRWETGWI